MISHAELHKIVQLRTECKDGVVNCHLRRSSASENQCQSALSYLYND